MRKIGRETASPTALTQTIPSTMDPFPSVLADAQQQLEQLQRTNDPTQYTLLSQELDETIVDLTESINSIKQDPEMFGLSPGEIMTRENQVTQLQSRLYALKNNKSTANRIDHTIENQNAVTESLEQEEMSQQILQQHIDQQDTHLDGVYTSMQNINRQARMMGDELEEQGYIMEELEGDLDRVTHKVQRGLRRVEDVIRRNQEKASDCCIGLLVVALVVLLVLVVIL